MTIHKVLIGFKVFTNDGYATLKALISQASEFVTIQRASSIYRFHVETNEPTHIHDLKSLSSTEGMAVVVKATTSLDPNSLQEQLEQTEESFRGELSTRNVSLNLLVYEDMTLMTPDLTLPHPEFHRRAEFIVPASEVWGDYRHPVIEESLFSLTQAFSGESWGEFYAQGKTLLDF